jgi:hypothetical protein
MGVDIKIIIINLTLIALGKLFQFSGIERSDRQSTPRFIDILLPNITSDRIRLKRLSTELFVSYQTVYRDMDLLQVMALILLRY